jgi:hypothetical protein
MPVFRKEAIKIEENSMENPKKQSSTKWSNGREMTNVWIPVLLRDELNNIKLVEQEPWYSVIQRLINEHNKKLLLKKKK